MIKAIIFDMDGVISDTVPPIIQAESKVFAKYDIQITPDEILARFNGVSDPVMYAEVFEQSGKEPNLEKLAEEKLAMFKELAKNNIKPIPGVIEFFNALYDKKIPLAVASASPAAIVEIVLTEVGIKNKLEVIVTPEHIKDGSLKTEMLLLAAKKLGVVPQECLVIEDAAKGITAAKNAGMKCIAITTTHEAKDLQEADKIVNTFSELNADTITSMI